MMAPEEVIIAVTNRLKSAESSLRSSMMKRDGLIDQLQKANDSIQHTTTQIQELNEWLTENASADN